MGIWCPVSWPWRQLCSLAYLPGNSKPLIDLLILLIQVRELLLYMFDFNSRVSLITSTIEISYIELGNMVTGQKRLTMWLNILSSFFRDWMQKLSSNLKSCDEYFYNLSVFEYRSLEHKITSVWSANEECICQLTWGVFSHLCFPCILAEKCFENWGY